MELGKIQSLKVDRKKDFGVYLTDGNGEDVLLPMKEVPKECEVGSEIEVRSEERFSRNAETDL